MQSYYTVKYLFFEDTSLFNLWTLQQSEVKVHLNYNTSRIKVTRMTYNTEILTFKSLQSVYYRLRKIIWNIQVIKQVLNK